MLRLLRTKLYAEMHAQTYANACAICLIMLAICENTPEPSLPSLDAIRLINKAMLKNAIAINAIALKSLF